MVGYFGAGKKAACLLAHKESKPTAWGQSKKRKSDATSIACHASPFVTATSSNGNVVCNLCNLDGGSNNRGPEQSMKIHSHVKGAVNELGPKFACTSRPKSYQEFCNDMVEVAASEKARQLPPEGSARTRKVCEHMIQRRESSAACHPIGSLPRRVLLGWQCLLLPQNIPAEIPRTHRGHGSQSPTHVCFRSF